jgi:hypothetical protein
MRLLIPAGHRDADAILEGRFSSAWTELRETLAEISPPLRAAEPFTLGKRPDTPKRHKVKTSPVTYRMLPIDQSELNFEIDRRLKTLGWKSQPYAIEAVTGEKLPTFLQGDFAKQSVFVEVEFGNQASLFRDLFKFQIAGQTNAGQVGILVTATSQVARFFDSGVATFEQAQRLLPFMRIGLSLPTAIIGLDLSDEDWGRVEKRYAEMQAVAETNGVVCRSFDEVRALPMPDQEIEQALKE